MYVAIWCKYKCWVIGGDILRVHYWAIATYATLTFKCISSVASYCTFDAFNWSHLWYQELGYVNTKQQTSKILGQ